MLRVGSDFSGVGAFEQALERLNLSYKKVFACDMDKHARKTYCLNFGTNQDFLLANIDSLGETAISTNDFSFYYPKNVYERKIPNQPLDIYMSSPPCQAFSLAGKRLGENDKRGILFYNTYDFIKENKPRFFIIENVKGLLSDDKGRTFNKWILLLSGKSINGTSIIYPHEEALPYHVYYKVLNAKNYNIPQNRERVFIIGIRNDVDNVFTWPKEVVLQKSLKDVLENEVDEKYFLSDKALSGLIKDSDNQINKGLGFKFSPKNINQISNTICAKEGFIKTGNYLKIGTWRTHDDGKGFRETEDNLCPTIPARARQDGSGQPVIKIGAIRGRKNINKKYDQKIEMNELNMSNAITSVQKDNVLFTFVNNSKGFDVLRENEDTINLSTPTPKTRRERIRRLTPLECFRLMDFNPSFKWNVSDIQAYKQAGNSICVGVLAKIIERLKI
ncbi:MAG: DNA (cytosine-5-)-methyltransferase [Flavobacterium sp.]